MTISYINPVYDAYFADPMVLKVGRDYYAYGTDTSPCEGMQFPVLHSRDLVHWRPRGNALKPLRLGAYAYWAPEVAHHEGRFYLFYSASTVPTDDGHRLRVATSDRPEGPFEDCGRELLPDAGFTIDAHPFRDPRDGRWYLFFATDYTSDDPTGTGLAVVPLDDDLLSARGSVVPVLRASSDWQIYERHRNYKDRVWRAWYCIEGPFVVFRQERYWCLFSGGNWTRENYGIGCAVADHPLGPWRLAGADPAKTVDADTMTSPTVLRGVPNHVIGPGHASVVRMPDERSDVLVYHAWDIAHSARRMCIDPLIWTENGPVCDGPSYQQRQLEPS